jgi:hypothetical protein
MAVYQFRSKDGWFIEREYAAIDVPDSIVDDGVMYFAQFGPTPGQGVPSQINRHERHIAYTLPRRWQDKDLARMWGKWDERGHVVCEGKRDRVELQARLRASSNPLHHQYVWDQGHDQL